MSSDTDTEFTELSRRVTQLEQRFDRVEEAARQRADDFGSVRAQANRAEKLAEEVRDVQRAPGRQEVSVITRDRADILPARSAVTPEQISVWVKEAVASAISSEGTLAQRYPQAKQSLDRIVQILSRAGIDIDTKEILGVIVDQILKRIDQETIKQALAGRVQSRRG